MPYIYQADCFCDSCGKAIANRLLKGASEDEIADWADERKYDSDKYPKYMPYDEESDSPQHCGSHSECLEAIELPSGDKIGALLSSNLTEDGVRYLKEIIAEGGEVAEFWAIEFSDYL